MRAAGTVHSALSKSISLHSRGPQLAGPQQKHRLQLQRGAHHVGRGIAVAARSSCATARAP